MTQTPPPDAPRLPDTSANDESLCEPCAGIQRNWRGAKGHAELIQGTHRSVVHKHGAVTITKFRCERCGSIWEYENSKVNREAGWSIPRRR